MSIKHLTVACLLWIVAVPAKAQDEHLQEAAATFVADAYEVRVVLREGDAAQEIAAERFWETSVQFADLVSGSEAGDAPLLTLALHSLSQTIRDDAVNGSDVDMAKLNSLQSSLEEQVAVLAAPAAFPGAEKRIDVQINAVRNDQPVHGLYVWLDFPCCARSDRSAFPLPEVTNPVSTKVIPATYLVRLVRDGSVVASRELPILTPGRVDVVVP